MPRYRRRIDQARSAVSEAPLAGRLAHRRSGRLSVLPAALQGRRVRAGVPPRRHHHRRRERDRQIDDPGGHRGAGRLSTRPAAARAIGRSIIPTRVRGDGRRRLRRRCARAGCRRSRPAGSSAPRASSPSRAISTARRSTPARPPPDFLSHSHGEGFLRFFDERCDRQGIYIFDEPEIGACRRRRQIEFLKILRRMQQSRMCQVVMATHAPMLMAFPERRAAAADAATAWSRSRWRRRITIACCASSAPSRGSLSRRCWRNRAEARRRATRSIHAAAADRLGHRDQRDHVIPMRPMQSSGRSSGPRAIVAAAAGAHSLPGPRRRGQSPRLAFRIASSSVSPAEKQPGRSGNQTPTALSGPASSMMAT